jgi:hypothetical protein
MRFPTKTAACSILLLALAACGPGNGGGSYNNDPSPWLGMAQMGFGMMTAQPPHPTITNCSTFGQRGMGFSCVTP